MAWIATQWHVEQLARNDASYYASHNNECKLNVHEQIIQMATLGPVQAFFSAQVNGSITVEYFVVFLNMVICKTGLPYGKALHT